MTGGVSYRCPAITALQRNVLTTLWPLPGTNSSLGTRRPVTPAPPSHRTAACCKGPFHTAGVCVGGEGGSVTPVACIAVSGAPFTRSHGAVSPSTVCCRWRTAQMGTIKKRPTARCPDMPRSANGRQSVMQNPRALCHMPHVGGGGGAPSELRGLGDDCAWAWEGRRGAAPVPASRGTTAPPPRSRDALSRWFGTGDVHRSFPNPQLAGYTRRSLPMPPHPPPPLPWHSGEQASSTSPRQPHPTTCTTASCTTHTHTRCAGNQGG